MPSSSSGCSGPRKGSAFPISRGSWIWKDKDNGSSDAADIREPEELRVFFYYKSAFLKVWAGNPRHRNQLELIFKYRLLVPI